MIHYTQCQKEQQNWTHSGPRGRATICRPITIQEKGKELFVFMRYGDKLPCALCASVTKDSLLSSFRLLLMYARLSTMASTAITFLSMAAIMMVYIPMLDPASLEKQVGQD